MGVAGGTGVVCGFVDSAQAVCAQRAGLNPNLLLHSFKEYVFAELPGMRLYLHWVEVVLVRLEGIYGRLQAQETWLGEKQSSRLSRVSRNFDDRLQRTAARQRDHRHAVSHNLQGDHSEILFAWKQQCLRVKYMFAYFSPWKIAQKVNVRLSTTFKLSPFTTIADNDQLLPVSIECFDQQLDILIWRDRAERQVVFPSFGRDLDQIFRAKEL